MIYHRKDGGAVRTQPRDPNTIECAVCGTTWSEKADVWQDCAADRDVERHEIAARDVNAVKAKPPVRDPALPRKGTVVERDPIVVAPPVEGVGRVR